MVMRLEHIEKYIDDGNFPNAYSALEEVLSLGPKNTNALKMKALLLYFEGKFSEEALVWKRVISIDPEDNDALEYFERSFVEQREHEYFSDLLPTGGIRFLANPRSVVNSSFIGVMGCAFFLTLTNFSHRFAFLAKPSFSFLAFGLFVILPWVIILYVYFRALRDITVDREGIHLRTRTSDFALRWQDVSNFYLVRRHTKEGAVLFVLLISKLADRPPILISIGSNTVVRAPSFFVREITRVFHEPTYECLDNIKLPQKPTVFS